MGTEPGASGWARRLGRAFGGFRASLRGSAVNKRVELNRQTTEAEMDSASGKVILRRTTIDEVILPKDGPSGENG
ncbi:MAG: hypothetical protein AAGD00_00315 [Planctomycetota bacterium]